MFFQVRIVILEDALREKKLAFRLLQSFEDEGLIVCEEEERLGFAWTCKEIVDSLEVVHRSKRLEQEVFTYAILFSEFLEESRSIFNNI